jgi:Na+-transporting methylmalonyl-CoA/oxaloacetate decarboxylase gamma subunit
MINIKTLLVGIGFLLAVLIYIIHKIRLISANKERTAKIKNRKKKKINKRK